MEWHACGMPEVAKARKAGSHQARFAEPHQPHKFPGPLLARPYSFTNLFAYQKVLVMYVDQASTEQLRAWESELAAEYQAHQARKLQLDLTRGKPSAEQLSLSNALDGCLNGNYIAPDGTDTRNYGGLDGLPELKRLAAEILGVEADEVVVGGNSSLTLMYQAAAFGWVFGPNGAGSEWSKEDKVTFICPVPGYDRHFALTQELGIDMVTVPMLDDGPDMDAVEALIERDPSIRGLWCVPKYSNPTGCVYSEATVERIARLGQKAHPAFRVFWDNAYAVHDLNEQAPRLASIATYCRQHGTEDSVYQFTSTSKITFAGAGVSFFATSPRNLAEFKKHLACATIGPDKVNQLRHLRLIPDMDALRKLMAQHASLLQPRFEAVTNVLEETLRDSDLGSWLVPQGGYFVSFDTRPGLAREVVRLAGEAGVKLTPAGATFPYGKDPQDTNIRLAPSCPTVAELNQAMAIFVTCVKLASVRQRLG